MQFSNPLMLWGLLALVIPIIIHLFNFRRYRKIHFTNVKDLQEIVIKTQKNAKIKKWIVLMLRMLAIAALVIAFAGPHRGENQQKTNAGASYISVYIDNSFSMEATESGVSLLDLAKKRAYELSQSYSISDRFQLLTNDFSGYQQRFLNRDEFKEELDKISFSPVVRGLKEIQARQNALFSEVTGYKKSYLIGDFQKSTNNLEELIETDEIQTVLVPLESEMRSNISIDSCWFSSPIHQINTLNRLFVKIHSSSTETLMKIPIRLIVNEKQVGLANFDIEPKSEAIIEIPFIIHEKGICKATLEITDFPITFDDKFYFTFSIADEIGVMELTDNWNNNYLSTLFGKDSSFRFTKSEITKLDFSLLETNSLVVVSSFHNISTGLSESLLNFVSNGGSVVFFYPLSPKDNSIHNLLTQFEFSLQMFLDTIPTQFDRLALQDMLFTDVFERVPQNMEKPTVFQHWDISTNLKTDQLIDFENGSPALLRVAYNNGSVYLFTFPIDESITDFPRQPLFVPIMLRMALLSVQQMPLYQTIGLDKYVAFKNLNLIGDAVPKIVNNNDFSFIPGVQTQPLETRFHLYDNIQEAGFYTLISASDSLHFSLNYNREESLPECFNSNALESFISEHHLKNIKVLETKNIPISTSIMQLQQGDLLWRWFLIAALIFLLGEVLILRFWK